MPFRLLSLLPYYVHLSLYHRTGETTLCSARCQFGHNGKHDVGLVEGYGTDDADTLRNRVVVIAFASHRKFGPTIHRLGGAVFEASLLLQLFLRFSADLSGMRTFEYTKLTPLQILSPSLTLQPAVSLCFNSLSI